MPGTPPIKNKAWMRNNKIHISFTPSAALIKGVKRLSGRKYQGAPKYAWNTPMTVEAAEWAYANGLRLSPKLRAWLREKQTLPKIDRSLLKDLPAGLRPFQKKGALFIESRKGRALLADDMGLGKTIQALAWYSLGFNKAPAKDKPLIIVVCPSTAKMNWRIEAEKWVPGINVEILAGRKPYKLKTNTHMAIINYEILAYWTAHFKKIKAQGIIFDECHYIKNPKAKRTKAAKRLCASLTHVLALSGTPITNRPSEFFPILNILVPWYFPNFWKFAMKWCAAKHGRFGWDFTGASNEDSLNKILTQTVMLRRTKDQVLKQLPPKQRSVILLDDLKIVSEYNKKKEEIIKWLKKKAEIAKRQDQSKTIPQALLMIEKLKQAAVACKFDAGINWVKNYLETQNKLVIFGEHKETIDKLMEATAVYKPVKIDGSVKSTDRQGVVERFQTDPTCRVFVGSKAAKEAITLTAASATCFFEFWWGPLDHDQAEDRVHRIGQESDSVFAYYLIAAKTIEIPIIQLLDAKRVILTKIMNGKPAEDFSLLTKLIEQITEEN